MKHPTGNKLTPRQSMSFEIMTQEILLRTVMQSIFYHKLFYKCCIANNDYTVKVEAMLKLRGLYKTKSDILKQLGTQYNRFMDVGYVPKHDRPKVMFGLLEREVVPSYEDKEFRFSF